MPFDTTDLAKQDTEVPVSEQGAQLIEAGIARISDPKYWCQKASRQNCYGTEIVVRSVAGYQFVISQPVYTQYCAIGAVLNGNAPHDNGYKPYEAWAMGAMFVVATRLGRHSFADFNDSRTTTHQMVIAAMTKAASVARDPMSAGEIGEAIRRYYMSTTEIDYAKG